MDSAQGYALLADLILLVHVLFVAFVVLGLTLILIGRLRAWGWVRNPWFRLVHLLAIAVVVLQSWLGRACPLTVWEMASRGKAGDAVYPGSFIAHWLEAILYYRVSPLVFSVVYTLFALLVLLSWVLVRPRNFSRTGRQ